MIEYFGPFNILTSWFIRAYIVAFAQVYPHRKIRGVKPYLPAL